MGRYVFFKDSVEVQEIGDFVKQITLKVNFEGRSVHHYYIVYAKSNSVDRIDL